MRNFLIGVAKGCEEIGDFVWSCFRGLFVGDTRLALPIECNPGMVLVRGLRTHRIKRAILCDGGALIEVEGEKAFVVQKGQMVEVQCESS